VILDLFRRIHQGTLDAHARRAVARSGLDAAAQEDLDILRWMPSPREWWRLAYTPGGELVGLAAPSRTYNDPAVGYIGVVSEHRGHGYAYDLLVEVTHLLAAEGVDRIVAGTDTTNTPMVATFAKAGYPVDQERIDLIRSDASGGECMRRGPHPPGPRCLRARSPTQILTTAARRTAHPGSRRATCRTLGRPLRVTRVQFTSHTTKRRGSSTRRRGPATTAPGLQADSLVHVDVGGHRPVGGGGDVP
jgi:RimJ/RimL family protein N-acetyltransferase